MGRCSMARFDIFDLVAQAIRLILLHGTLDGLGGALCDGYLRHQVSFSLYVFMF
jgi:hypothetical protein